MLDINGKSWQSFKVLDLFDYKRGDQKNMASLDPGDCMLVSARNTNNGVKGFFECDNKHLYKGNCITLNNDGDGGVCLAYYQPQDFLLDTHVYALYPKTDVCQEAMLFVAEALTKQRVCFSHGHSISQKRLREMKVLLPQTDTGKPDYKYMGEYIKGIKEDKRRKIIEFIENKLNILGEKIEIDSLDKKDWASFVIEEEFNCAKGIYLKTGTATVGDIPFITAKEGNNGISRFIGNGTLFDGNRITIEKIRLNAYWQPVPFYCSHDVSVIWNESINEYSSLFISAMITRNGIRYSYGRQAQLNVVSRERVLLPTSDGKRPDYAYMEQYAKNLIIDKYKEALAFFSNYPM